MQDASSQQQKKDKKKAIRTKDTNTREIIDISDYGRDSRRAGRGGDREGEGGTWVTFTATVAKSIQDSGKVENGVKQLTCPARNQR